MKKERKEEGRKKGRKERKKEDKKRKDMTAPRSGGGESLLQTTERVQSESETSGQVQHGHDPEPCGERKGKRETRCSSQENKKVKKKRRVRKTTGLYRERQPSRWA